MTNHIQTIIAELESTEAAHELEINPMETQLHHTLSTFEEIEFPSELHGRIMKSIYLRQFKTPLVIINSILAVNFGISTYQLSRLVGPTVSKLAAEGSLHLGNLTPSLQLVLQSVPGSAQLVFGANLALLVIGGYLLLTLRKMLTSGHPAAER